MTNNILSLDKIRIETAYPIEALTWLEITSRVGEHSQFTLKGVLDSEDHGASILGRITDNDTVKIYERGEDSDELIFSGMVTKPGFLRTNALYTLEVEGKSHTAKLDYEYKCRSFQNGSSSYEDVMREVSESYGTHFLMHVPDKAIVTPIVQYEETDWAFLKRIATHLNTVLIAQDLGDEPRLYMGAPKYEKELEHMASSTMITDYRRYRYIQSQGFDVRKWEFEKHKVKSKTRLFVGDSVIFQGRAFVIEESIARYIDGLFEYEYLLCSESALIQPRQRNEQISGVSIVGSVIDSAHTSVKIHLSIDTEQTLETAYWYPYASQSNNMFYCMPEKGEDISLYFPDNEESNAIAVNAVRRNGGNSAKMTNPAIKYMSIPTGQEFKLGETDLSFTERAGLFMTLDDAQGLMMQSHNDIILATGSNIRIDARESVRMFARTGNILIGSGPDASMSQLYLMGGSSGDTHIYPFNVLSQDGRVRQPFPDQLNRAIAYEYVPPPDPPEPRSWLQVAIFVVAAVAVAAVVVLFPAVLAVVCILAKVALKGALIGAAISVGIQAASDKINGEFSGIDAYLSAAVHGAISGAVAALAFHGALAIKPIAALFSTSGSATTLGILAGRGLTVGGVGILTDFVNQIPSIARGSAYNWQQGLTSFAISFILPFGAHGIQRAAGSRLLARVPESLRRALSMRRGDPIDVVTGAMISEATDFELPGPIPLEWKRNWYSDSGLVGHLGHGSRCSFEVGMDVYEEEQALAVYLQDGRAAVFPQLVVGEEYFNHQEALMLRREIDHYCLFDPETRLSYLLFPSSGGYMEYKLGLIKNELGHSISMAYDVRGYLSQITDSAGRKLTVTVNSDGRITSVALGSNTLVQYKYDRRHNLIEAIDAMGQAIKMEYANNGHLMTSETDRNGKAFHWIYDGREPGSRVTRSWGGGGADGNTFWLELEYHDDERYTVVTGPQGKNPVEYHYDERKLCIRTVYSDYTETRREYNDRYELIGEIDEEGLLTSYRYNEHSQLKKILRPDGSTVLFTYDTAGRLTSSTNPDGGTESWVYNDDNALHIHRAENGAETLYAYNDNRLVKTVTNALGDAINLAYDEDYNLSKATLSDGSSSSWEYDSCGNCLSETNPLGAVQQYQYDKLNRMVKASLSDGNVVQLKYNGYDNVIYAKDKYNEASFEYTILGNLKAATQGKQRTEYTYDIEEQLLSVTKVKSDQFEKDEVYTFERDLKGNIIKEVGFDGLVRSYERGLSGLVKKVIRPGGRWTKYEHDKLGNIVRADYHDNTWETFKYNKSGMLTGADNQDICLKFEYDASGMMVKEWQGDKWIASEYDAVGNRTKITSSLGVDIALSRNSMGQIANVNATQRKNVAWKASVQYNGLGQEIERLLPGEIISRWQYDAVGRAKQHSVQSKGSNIRQRSYAWDISGKLKNITNDLTKHGVAFSYDELNNLVGSSARASTTPFADIHRNSDELGNLYESKDNSDRVYGVGSRLEKSGVDTKQLKKPEVIMSGEKWKHHHVTKGTNYTYDSEGNLTAKEKPNGEAWQYE